MLFPRESIVGKEFGEWRVLESLQRDAKGEMLYSCRCSCGLIKVQRRSILTHGHSLRCKSCSIEKVNATEDLTGKKFSKWRVQSRFKHETRNEIFYSCVCECGTKRNIPGYQLKLGQTTQCHRCRNKTHGMSYTDTFRIWTGILRRCLNNKFKHYKSYGGRGIKVCDRWLVFENFYADMGDRPAGLQIDRIDNDGHYEPGNCRWVTSKENNANKTRKKEIQ